MAFVHCPYSCSWVDQLQGLRRDREWESKPVPRTWAQMVARAIGVEVETRHFVESGGHTQRHIALREWTGRGRCRKWSAKVVNISDSPKFSLPALTHGIHMRNLFPLVPIPVSPTRWQSWQGPGLGFYFSFVWHLDWHGLPLRQGAFVVQTLCSCSQMTSDGTRSRGTILS